jgi:peroxiredoxin
MKKLLSLSIIALLFFSCTTQPKYNLTVSLDGVEEGMYYLTTRQSGEWINHDSAKIIDKVAVFTIKNIDLPEVMFVQLKGQKSRFPVFIENSNIDVRGDSNESDKIVITGSESQTEYDVYLEKAKVYDDQLKNLYAEYRKANEEKNEAIIAEINTEYDEINEQKVEFNYTYVLENPASVVNAYIAFRNNYYFELNQLETITTAFDPLIDNSTYVKDLKAKVITLKSVAIGKKFIDFTMNDVNDNPVVLSSLLNGKYVLLDFWAAWCGPCRRENPNVVAVFNDYKDRGFGIVGISLDRKKEDWLKAIEDDKLTWSHVSDLLFWNSAAAKLYGVNSIPHSILLDPDGVIIAKNLRGEKLRNKIAELLD